MRKLLTLILSFLIIHSASAYEFNSISTSNSDISYDGISYICQDSRGFMWIGTYKGLNRYDGYSFVTYDYADLGLESDFIHIIVEDKEGNLWVGTDQGVSIYYYKKDHFEPFLLPSDKNVVIQNKVTYIMVDEDGSVWLLANEQGCFNYNCQTGELKSVLYDELGISGLRRMARSEDGRIWVSRYHSNLYTTADNFNTIIPVDLGSYSTYFEGDEIEGLFPGSNGRLYVASYKNGLSVINTINKSVRQLFALPPTSLLQQAFFDKKTAFWLATSEGLYSYDLNSGETIKYTHLPSDPYTISNDYTTAVYVDSKDGVWVGTKDSGLNYAGAFQKNFEKQYIAEGESLRGSLISGFAEDAYGRIWIASEEKGLLVYDPTTHKTSFFKNPLLPLRLCAVCIEGDILWCGTHQGLFSVNVKSGAVKNYGVLKRKIGVSDPHVYMLFRTSGGDLYAGTTLGVFKYCPEQDLFVEIERFSGYFPTAAAEQTLSDGSKRIWFSTYANGLLCWNPNGDSELTIYNSKTDSGLSNNKMSSVFIDSKNDIWAIGFTSGFYKLHKDTGKFMLYDGQTLPSQLSSVYFKAVEDDRASLWLSSDVGLVEYNQKIGACLYTPFKIDRDNKREREFV